MKRKIITSVLLLIAAVSFAGCGATGNGTGIPKGNAPVYPQIIDFGASVEASSSVLTKDESGLFSYTMGITNVSYCQNVPGIYADLPEYVTPKTGVRFDANISGAQIYYNRVVDLNSIEGDLITFEVYSNDRSDVSGIAVELIDIYDQSKTVKVFWNEASASTVANQHVTCNGITLGCANDSTQNYGLPRVQYGTICYTASFQEWYRASYTHKPFHFRFNEKTNEVIADVSVGKNANFTILDVDNPIHMGESNCFEGFTTGEVYLRITFEKISVGGSLVITTIGGNDTSAETLEKEPSNSIKILLDDKSYEKNMPVGKVGAGYPVPVADGKDLIRGEYPIYTMVKAPDGSTVKQQDGEFIPTVAGEYSIIYTAKDINDFRIIKTLKVSVAEEIDDLEIVPVSLPALSYRTGIWTRLPAPQVTGGSGTISPVYSYTLNGKLVIPNSLGKYLFKETGTLKVSVNATDYLNNTVSGEYEFVVTDVPEIVLTDPMPFGVESGDIVYLPDFYVNSYEGLSFSEKTVSVNGVTLAANRKCVVPESGKLNIVYSAVSQTGDYVIKEYSVSVTPKRTVTDSSSLFLSNGKATVSQAENGVLLEAIESDNEVSYAYPLSADNTEINVRWTDRRNFDYIEFLLADALDPKNEIAFRLYTSSYLAQNARVQDENGSFDTYKHPISSKLVETERLHVFYNNFKKTFVNVNLVKTAQVRYTTNGEIFQGFESGILTLKIRLGGIRGGAAVVVAGLGNQAFDTNVIEMGDLRPAQLAPEKEIKDGVRAVGSTLIVPKAKAVDALSLNATVLVSLRAPDGTYLLSEEECDVERTFILDKCGTYTLNYILEDANWNIDRDKVYYITSVDETPPEITVSGEYENAYAVGSKITPLKTTVYDEVSETENLKTYVLVFTPKYETILLLPDNDSRNSFVVEQEGYYRIIHYVVDEAGNYNLLCFEIQAY